MSLTLEEVQAPIAMSTNSPLAMHTQSTVSCKHICKTLFENRDKAAMHSKAQRDVQQEQWYMKSAMFFYLYGVCVPRA
jgi:hypothetical protein